MVSGAEPLTSTLTEPQQREISRLAVLAGQRLLQHGAESTLVTDVTCRLGLALGVESVEVSLSASSMVITTLSHGRCITTTRRCQDRGINMQVVTEVQRVVIMAERGLLDIQGVHDRLLKIQALRYNRVLVIFMIGLSCASFSRPGRRRLAGILSHLLCFIRWDVCPSGDSSLPL